MCNVSVGFFENAKNIGEVKGRAEGIKLGKAEGIKLGKAEGKAESVSNLMKSMNISIDEAMDFLGIAKEDRSGIKNWLNK